MNPKILKIVLGVLVVAVVVIGGVAIVKNLGATPNQATSENPENAAAGVPATAMTGAISISEGDAAPSPDGQ